MKAESSNRKSKAGIAVSVFWLFVLGAQAQINYSLDWFKVSGGGGTSTRGVYSVSGTIGQPDASGAVTGGNYSLTHRRRAVVCWHSHHANTSFSQAPFLASARCRSSNSSAANPRASNRSASASPCARLASPL